MARGNRKLHGDDRGAIIPSARRPRLAALALLALGLAGCLGASPAAAQVSFTGGYVNPEHGDGSTRFTYALTYFDTANTPPTHIWVAIWWESRGADYWYEMSPLYPWDTNYTNGASYRFSITGLDSSIHAYRFAVQVGSAFYYWPLPTGIHEAGPTVAAPAVRMGTVSVTCALGPQPSVMLQADRSTVDSGSYVTFTATAMLPSNQTWRAGGVTVTYRPDAMFTAVDGAAPFVIANTATLTTTERTVQTPQAGVRVNGRQTSVFPAGGVFVAGCGDLAPGESTACTFRCSFGVASSQTPLSASAGPGKTIALGGSATLEGSASGGSPPYTYSWTPTTGLDNPNIARPAASPAVTTTYLLTVTDSAAHSAGAPVTVTVGVDDAAVVSATMPGSVVRKGSQTVQVRVRNAGTTVWTWGDGYALASASPDDNTTWGTARVPLGYADSIAPGASKTFSFSITAPDVLASGLTCAWQMVHGSTHFGAVATGLVDTYSFADVPRTLSYWKYVEALFKAGITNGCGVTADKKSLLFCPSNASTRKEAAVFLVRAAGMAVLDRATPTFADVPKSLPAYPYIERLADAGSWYDAHNPCLTAPTQGCGNSPPKYCPEATVTRAMMAVYLCRACGKCTLNNSTPTFADVPRTASYYAFVERLADPASWNNDPPTQGCATNPRRYCPNDFVTRAQMAVYLVRAFGVPY